jgi:predicted ATPase
MKRDRPKVDTDTFKFKALPIPKLTYIAEEITLGSPVVTQPKSPGLAITRRAEARRLFDIQLHEKEVLQSEMKEKQEQHEKELEDAEIQRQRRSYADDGGFCFKAMSISIEYI